MSRTNGIFIAIVVCAVLAAVVFSVADFAGDKVYASPEEVFKASCEAIKKKDLRAWCQCLTDDSRDVIVSRAVLFFFKESMAKAPKEQQAMYLAMADVQTKYGLTEEFLAKLEDEALALDERGAPTEVRLKFAQKVLAPVSDRNAFFADLYAAILTDPRSKNPFAALADAKLSEVKTSGKVAEGIVTTPFMDKENSMPMVFRKQGEGWRIDVIASEQPPPPRPGFRHPG